MTNATPRTADKLTTPSAHFAYSTDISQKNVTPVHSQILRTVPVEDYFAERAPSSSYSAFEIFYRVQVESPAHTASRISLVELCADLLRAEKRAASVNYADAPENLFELRRLTGFTWSRLAKLLNVDRRTLNNWVKGAKIREKNSDHIGKTLEILRFADRGASELNAMALNAHHPLQEHSPFEAIRFRNYETAKQSLSYGLSRPQSQYAATDIASWSGEFRPMVIHPDADGTEKIEPLPYEPAPAYRKRKIKRG